ncbi:alpha/beta hydrolase [Cohnella endophytica]|uniref:Alpha/beta hydrolase n=1 Tax=Cohnella endophytica TaxID=2419778 RepID=A0A494Y5P7_9BACL|nr:alpha/beta hydrolase [Cohnella endophytica]RKP58009.1 alpha/beta hydrolase [Cohnella endophytica]
MVFSTWDWRCSDGTRMYACEWSPEQDGTIPAVIGFVHGMGEHMGRYAHVADMLVAEGYAVLGFDQRGHGRTEGKRGHVPAYEDLLEGVDLLIGEARHRYPNAPFFLFGHSMGGNVTLNHLLRRQPDIAGAIVTGPWLKLAFKPPSLQAAIGKVIERVYPRFTNNRPINAQNLTTDPDMVERYVTDELGHGHITARFFFGVQRAGTWALEHAGRLTVPLLLMHGGDDKVTSIQASRRFAELAPPELVEWQEWPEYKHELHNETGREEVFSVIRDWLKKQLDAERSPVSPLASE